MWELDHRREQPNPSHQAAAEIGREFRLDIISEWWSWEKTCYDLGPFFSPPGLVREETRTEESEHDGFAEDIHSLHTPAGKLEERYLRSVHDKPGYQSKYLLESPQDAERWLSIPAGSATIDASGFLRARRDLGEDGIMMIDVGSDPMYQINTLVGSETWGFWLKEERALLHRLVAEAQARTLAFVKALLGAGVNGLFGYCGPELCIPPLASPSDFQEFVVGYDERIHDLIHEAGGQVWVHCHGKMGPVLEGFLAEGVDCLNPLEPPPMGDMTIGEARARVGDRMSFDGGVQIGDFEICSPVEIAQKTEAVLEESEGRGLILSATSGLSDWPVLSDRILANFRTFCAVGRDVGARVCAKGG